jgi:hypothetical protein
VRNGNNLEGWARFEEIRLAGLSSNAGGWLGWIKMRGTAQNESAYGVSINEDGTLAGYGYSNELGWVDFSRASINVTNTLKICRVSCDTIGGLVSSGINESMLINETKNYTACYNASSTCDTNSGDVTTIATWADNDTLNDVVSVSGGVVTSGASAGTEGVIASYNPGTGNINAIFDVQVSAPAQKTCYKCNKLNGSCSSHQQISCDTGDGEVRTTCQTNCKRDTNWKEVAP